MPPKQPPRSDDTPTSPDLLAVRCPRCKGAGGFLAAAPGETGKPRKLVHTRCPLCEGTRRVSRQKHAEWYATRPR